MRDTPHLVVSISGHGFGHVAQTAPILNLLHERMPQLRITLRSAVASGHLRSRILAPFTHLPSEGDIGMLMSSALDVRIEDSRDEGRKLSGIFVQYAGKKGDWYAVTAERGQFLATDNPDEIIFRLSNGTLINNAPDFVTPRVLTFTSHDLPIPLPKYESFRTRGGLNLERTLPELVRIGHDAHASEQDRDTSRAAFHFRLAEVLSMFFLPLLALALGIPPKRSTSALGVFLSVVMVVAYHKVNEYGQALGGLGKIDPFFALWVPFVVFAGICSWMFYVIAFVPGGQPIGGLERGFSKVTKWIARLLPKRGEAEPE